MELEPLNQRTTGRRAQRRIEREGLCRVKDDDTHDETIFDGGSKIINEVSEQRRCPSRETERQIDALIEQRKKTMAESAITNANAYDDDHEIFGNYEYLDHTADIQLHGWGNNLQQALEQVALAMFGYMTNLSLININSEQCQQHAKNIIAKGHDLHSLVFGFLQEWLYVFHETGFIARQVTIHSVDRETFTICSSAQGEVAEWNRHTQGTEVKAVTYSSLQVNEDKHRCDIWTIVDI